MAEQRGKRVDHLDVIMHELKTPLTAIIASAELLEDELQPDKTSVIRRLIQSIIRNAHSINERLTLFAETGGLLSEGYRFHPELISIGQVIQDIATQLYPETQSRRQSLILEVPDSLPPTKADRQYLEQILLTLLANAIRFTKEEGKITISAHHDGSDMIVEVRDTGIGIPTEEQTRIFQPYYQVNLDKNCQPMSQNNDRMQNNNGLGLAIAKFLVELHEGKIWLKSESGRGSSFFFSLPTVVSVESTSN